MKYKKVIIYFFSGTGNAKNTALWIGDEVIRKGIDIEIVSIDKIHNQEIPKPADFTLVGFCSPTHGFHFPKIMQKFIYRFTKVDNCSAFVVNTRAGLRIGRMFLPGLSGVLHYWSSLILIKKGFKIIGLRPVDLPSNWLLLHPALRKKSIKLIFKHNEPKVRKFAKKILNGKKDYRALYDIIQDTLISPVAIGYMYVGRYLFAKSFISSSDCDNCCICEKTCPVNAIKQVDGRMFWTYKCESCMKCMNNCPQKAIETAHGFVLVFVFLLVALLRYGLKQLLTIEPFKDLYWLRTGVMEFVIFSLIFIPFLILAYRIMHWLLRFRIFERFFVYTSLSKYKFWGRYKAPKNKLNINI
jgi:ferredoxin